MSESLKILLVDDNPGDRALVIQTLSREFPGIQVEQIKEASGFAEALERGEFDLVSTDYQLKWTDGLAIVRAVKARWPNCPVIMLTGNGSEEIAVETMKNGLDDYVLKSPKHYIRLPGAVKKAMERAKAGAERKQVEEEIRESRDRLRALTAKLQVVQEEERKRIAREIHDELGQHLTAIRFDLVKLARTKPSSSAQVRKSAGVLVKLVDKTIDSVRRIAISLRPNILDDLGLAAAMEWLIQDFRTRTGIACDVSLCTIPPAMDDARSITLFRILQESLTNIMRHAQATRVAIDLHVMNGSLVLEVSDNGRGLAEQERASPASLGLQGMQERASFLGGEVTVQGRPGKGTVLTARIPLPSVRDEI